MDSLFRWNHGRRLALKRVSQALHGKERENPSPLLMCLPMCLLSTLGRQCMIEMMAY